MLQGFFDPYITEGPNLELRYPARAKHPTERLTVADKPHAVRLWHIRTRKYIFDTLRGWVMQRQYAIRVGENHFRKAATQKHDATERLLFCLLSHYESPLHRLAFRIAQHRKDVELIAPPANSKLIAHYEEVIVPMVDWCEEYGKSMANQKQRIY